MLWKVRSVGDSKAHVVILGPRQSFEGDLLEKVVPAKGLNLIRKKYLFGSERWDALNLL